jgi:SHS2 domain-containing protein
MAFEVIEHTADAGIVAKGATRGEAFAEAARGMYSLMVDLEAVRPEHRREFDLREGNDEKLLVSWLLELLFLTETEGLVFSKFEVAAESGRLRAKAWGEALDEERHHPGALVKGVTRHMMAVQRNDAGQYEVRVIFDL